MLRLGLQFSIRHPPANTPHLPDPREPTPPAHIEEPLGPRGGAIPDYDSPTQQEALPLAVLSTKQRRSKTQPSVTRSSPKIMRRHPPTRASKAGRRCACCLPTCTHCTFGTTLAMSSVASLSRPIKDSWCPKACAPVADRCRRPRATLSNGRPLEQALYGALGDWHPHFTSVLSPQLLKARPQRVVRAPISMEGAADASVPLHVSAPRSSRQGTPYRAGRWDQGPSFGLCDVMRFRPTQARTRRARGRRILLAFLRWVRRWPQLRSARCVVRLESLLPLPAGLHLLLGVMDLPAVQMVNHFEGLVELQQLGCHLGVA